MPTRFQALRLFTLPLWLGVLAVALCAAPARATSAGAPQDDVAARAGETTVSWEELDGLIFVRHANSPEGHEALKHLLKTKLLDQLALESGLVVRDEEVDALWRETEESLRQAGQGDLPELLAQQGMSAAEFREFLRLGVVQRTLARRALGIPDDQPISGELQETWLEKVIVERGLVEPPAPWTDGVVLSCGGVTIGVDEYVTNLRYRIDPAALRQGMEQILLEKRLRERMPDLAESALDKAVNEELARRRTNVLADPRYKGIGYDELMKAKGILIDYWPEDPSLRAAALTRLWVERRYSEEDLRRTYQDEREYFDGHFGEAIETWVLFLRAGVLKNDLVPRTFDEAERELFEITRAVRSSADFEVVVLEHSEAVKSRELRGRVGFVTRLGSTLPAILRDEIFRCVDEGSYAPDLDPKDRRRLTHAIRTSEGVALCWLGERTPTPAWDEMIVHVHAELRARVQDDSLDTKSVVTYLDTE
ncbi:MAG: hypothetical protein H6831_10380 [Planctomycetes bacterium]|nr:hypothetical protein [Planctomycetota bacterium]MCB9904802.1 hypothetical protein [Planctomycetota bacterium]